MSVFTGFTPSGQSEHVSRAPYPPRISSLPLQSIPRKPVANATENNKAVTIAISGCSSSGKTTLAILLAEIFSTSENIPWTLLNDEVVDMKDFLEETENKNKDGKDNDKGYNGRPIIIHQDSYFVDKSWCPSVTFESTPADVEFVRSTLVDDRVGIYTIVDGDCHTIGYINECEGQVIYSSTTGTYIWRDSHLTNHDGGSAANASPSHPYWCITGPDTDCWAALDITALSQAIQHVQDTGTVSDDTRRRDEATAVGIPGLLVTTAQRDAILSEHAPLIAEMKEVVNAWMKEHALAHAKSQEGGPNVRAAIKAGNAKLFLRPMICFIEGFLLFPEPTSTLDKDNSDANKEIIPLTPNLSRSVSENNFNYNDRRGSWYITQNKAVAHQSRNPKVIRKLMSNFDIKLFLPTSKEEAKARRFVRDCYIDAPNGERHPGQLWKSEGYFNDVVWANYIKEHTWLFGEDPNCSKSVNDSAEAKEAGLHVCPVIDAGIEYTVEWSVRAILGELGKFARVEVSEVNIYEGRAKKRGKLLGWLSHVACFR